MWAVGVGPSSTSGSPWVRTLAKDWYHPARLCLHLEDPRFSNPLFRHWCLKRGFEKSGLKFKFRKFFHLYSVLPIYANFFRMVETDSSEHCESIFSKFPSILCETETEKADIRIASTEVNTEVVYPSVNFSGRFWAFSSQEFILFHFYIIRIPDVNPRCCSYPLFSLRNSPKIWRKLL